MQEKRLQEKEQRLHLLRSMLFPLFDEAVWQSDVNHPAGLTISEDKHHIFVEADLPGLQAEDIDLSFEEGTLWIRGERKEEEEDKEKKYSRRASRSFSYRVQIPSTIDEKKDPEAIYKNGILKVSFVKTSHTRPKTIPIKTN